MSAVLLLQGWELGIMSEEQQGIGGMVELAHTLSVLVFSRPPAFVKVDRTSGQKVVTTCKFYLGDVWDLCHPWDVS